VVGGLARVRQLAHALVSIALAVAIAGILLVVRPGVSVSRTVPVGAQTPPSPAQAMTTAASLLEATTAKGGPVIVVSISRSYTSRFVLRARSWIWTRRPWASNSPTTTSFTPANRPTSDSLGGSYTSDGDGRLTSQPNQRLAWDALGRLTTVYPATGSTPLATYTYDPLDRLRMVDYGGTNRVRFRYVGLTTSAAQTIDDQSGSVLRNIGTGWGGERQLDWTGTNSNIRYYGTNAHHDTVWTASSTGSVSATLRYDPWGVLMTSTGASLPDFRFQGSWFDGATALQWVVSRWYAPSLGRFVSEDSLLGSPSDPPSRHLYAYAEANPTNAWDADGSTCRFGGDDCYALAMVHAAGGWHNYIEGKRKAAIRTFEARIRRLFG
jgi:RHS repeat-associated protein